MGRARWRAARRASAAARHTVGGMRSTPLRRCTSLHALSPGAAVPAPLANQPPLDSLRAGEGRSMRAWDSAPGSMGDWCSPRRQCRQLPCTPAPPSAQQPTARHQWRPAAPAVAAPLPECGRRLPACGSAAPAGPSGAWWRGRGEAGRQRVRQGSPSVCTPESRQQKGSRSRRGNASGSAQARQAGCTLTGACRSTPLASPLQSAACPPACLHGEAGGGTARNDGQAGSTWASGL